MWRHYCPSEQSTIDVGDGESCNWCGNAQDGLPDDRVLCTQCRELGSNLYCKALKVHTIPTLPLRCMHFVPLKTLADQRPGVKRWPTLQVDIEEIRRIEEKGKAA